MQATETPVKREYDPGIQSLLLYKTSSCLEDDAASKCRLKRAERRRERRRELYQDPAYRLRCNKRGRERYLRYQDYSTAYKRARRKQAEHEAKARVRALGVPEAHWRTYSPFHVISYGSTLRYGVLGKLAKIPAPIKPTAPKESGERNPGVSASILIGP